MKSQRGRGGMRGMRRGRGGGRGRGGRLGGGKMGGDNDDGDGYGDEMEVRLVTSNESCCSFVSVQDLTPLLQIVYTFAGCSIQYVSHGSIIYTAWYQIIMYALQESELVLF